MPDEWSRQPSSTHGRPFASISIDHNDLHAQEVPFGTVPFSETVLGSAQADARGLVDPPLLAQRPSLPRCTPRFGSLVAPLLVRALRLRVRPAYHRNRCRPSASPANGPASIDIEFRWLTDDARLRLARCGRNSQPLARLGRPAWEQVRQVRPGTAGPRTNPRIWDSPSALLAPAAPS